MIKSNVTQIIVASKEDQDINSMGERQQQIRKETARIRQIKPENERILLSLRQERQQSQKQKEEIQRIIEEDDEKAQENEHSASEEGTYCKLESQMIP